MSKSNNWCYTANNYTDNLFIILYGLTEDDNNPQATYNVMGFEVGEQGTPHIQGYVHFKNPKSFNTVNNLCHNRVYWAPMISNPTAASDYCKKDGDYLELGSLPLSAGKGHQIKTADIISEIKAGASYTELLDKYPTFCFHNEKKVKSAIASHKANQKVQTKFYIIDDDDPITQVHDLFKDDIKLAVIYELSDIEDYDDYDTVLWKTDFYERKHNDWPRGVPITYRYGYEIKRITCKSFIISSPHVSLYERPLYKKL